MPHICPKYVTSQEHFPPSPKSDWRTAFCLFSWLFLAHMIPTVLKLVCWPSLFLPRESNLFCLFSCVVWSIIVPIFLSFTFSYASLSLAYEGQIFFFWGSLSFTDHIFSPYFLKRVDSFHLFFCYHEEMFIYTIPCP